MIAIEASASGNDRGFSPEINVREQCHTVALSDYRSHACGGRCSNLTRMRAPGLLPEQVCTDPRFGRTEENFGEVRKSSSWSDAISRLTCAAVSLTFLGSCLGIGDGRCCCERFARRQHGRAF